MLSRSLLTTLLATALIKMYGVVAEPGYCLDHGYVPENGTRNPMPKTENKYSKAAVIRYSCNDFYMLNTSESVQTCTSSNGIDYSWEPATFPSCVPVPELTTDQMPYTPHDDIYCKLPQPSILDGEIKCCLVPPVVTANSTSDHCCPDRGLVEFKCNAGYSLKGAPDRWICGSYGKWLFLDQDKFGYPSDPPKCYSNDTRDETSSFSDETLKQVFGVAAGVLVILSAVIIFALCRPKLINMKRRWRKLRDDEDELVIDGRRIVLPSYEEATTSRDLYLSEEPSSSSHIDVSQPPSSENQRMEPEQSCESNLVLCAKLVSPSTASNQEMLVTEDSLVWNEDNAVSSSQSLILTAGASVNASVMINSPPHEVSHDNGPISRAIDGILPRRNSDDSMLVLDSDSECNLDSIFPSNSTSSSSAQQAPVINSGLDLLNFPLGSTEYESNKFLEPQSFSVIINSGSILSNTEIGHNEHKAGLESYLPVDEDSTNLDESCDVRDSPGHLIGNPNHLHIKLSSPTSTQNMEEMGSTVV